MSWAPLIPLIMAGGSALSSWLGNRGNKKQDSVIDETSTSTPTYDPQALAARNAVLDAYKKRMGNYQGFLTGYTGQGMRKINRGADIRTQALQNTLAARGLGSSPIAAALESQGEDDRIQQLVDFYSNVPLVGRQMESEDLSGLGQFVASLPTGQTTTRKGTTTGTAYGSTSNALGSALGSGISTYLLAKYYGDKSLNPGGGIS